MTVATMTPPSQQPVDFVTMGHIRSHGCRDLLVYCNSVWCNHSARLNADWLSDDTVLLQVTISQLT